MFMFRSVVRPLFPCCMRRSRPSRFARASSGSTPRTSVAFTKLLNDPKAAGELAEMKIVAAYPGGSPDLPASWDRVKGYTDTLRGMGVEIVGSIDELLKRVDVVLLESVDGRPHLAQARPVIAAGKPLFIDKPMAASLADAMRIFRLAKEKNVPCFSASSLRFSAGFQAVRQRHSRVRRRSASCTAGARCTSSRTTPTSSGTESTAWRRFLRSWGQAARRSTRTAPDKVVGVWKDGRRGHLPRQREGYGAKVEGSKKSGDAGKYEGYEPLVVEIVKFFQTGKPPVECRGDAGNPGLHGSRRPEQTPRRRPGEHRKRDAEGETADRRTGRLAPPPERYCTEGSPPVATGGLCPVAYICPTYAAPQSPILPMLRTYTILFRIRKIVSRSGR